jgi:hypothetical protein
MTPHGTVRVLLVLAEVVYTGTIPDPTGSAGTALARVCNADGLQWPFATTLPNRVEGNGVNSAG